MSEQIKINYRGHEIRFCESLNNWESDCFSKPCLRLDDAKKKIDKKVDAEEKEPFKRFNVLTRGNYSSDGFRTVEVTSITEDGKSLWVSSAKGREKLGSYSGEFPAVYIPNPHNESLVSKVGGLNMAIKKCHKEIAELEKQMVAWKLGDPTV